jgi:spore coat protein CotH
MRLLPAAIALLLASSLSDAPPASAQTAADLFDSQTLQEIRLLINSKDLARLRSEYLGNTFYTADMEWRGTRVRNVAVRSRGSGSRNPVKLGLTIDFDRYTRNRRFLGMGSLVLDNLWQDPSMMRERLAMLMFDRLGQAAPRESFCRLFINNEYQGVYAIVEEPSGEFAERALGESGGYVFEYHWLMPFFGEDLGDRDAYKPLFEPRTHELEADATLYNPIQELFRQVNEPDDSVWRERVEAYVDLPQFITQVAIEAFVAEDDGLLGYAGMNNFYLYRPQSSSRHRMFPWDKDNAFLAADKPVMDHADENVLLRRALGYADLRELYLQVLEECARRATEDEWLAAEIERELTVISTAAHDDTRKQYSNEAFEESVEFLRDFARRRPALVLAEVARLRAEWDSR